MSFFSKNKTPREEIKNSRKNIRRLGTKRNNLDEKYKDDLQNKTYQKKRKLLTDKMNYEYKMIGDYQIELAHPANVSKSTTFAPKFNFTKKTENSVTVNTPKKYKRKK